MKIVMLEPLGISKEAVESLAKPFVDKGYEFVPCYEKIETKEEKIALAKGADVFIIANSPLDGDVIRASENLKLISVAFVGIDHVDIEACKEKGVTISNAAGYCTHSVAELTYGLMLSVLRNITPCDKATREGKTRAGLVGNELYGKTVGIVGTGAIGIRVAEIAKVFGCNLLGYSRTQKEEAKELGMKYVSLEELMSESDIVSLHTPLTPQTKLLINKENIALMKPSSILINVARGAVVDSTALAEALNNDKIAGAGIDVFEMEPSIPNDHPLLNSKNTLVAPHVAFATGESIFRRADMVFNNIKAFENGKPENVML
ncbi:2-hydroxyacid dehydrogenase [Clostridium sp. DL1XJH146]